MFKPLLCIRRLRRAMSMSERSRRRDGDPRGNQRPPEPKGLPPGRGPPSEMGLTPCAKGAAAPVVAPRYSSRPASAAEEPDRHGRSRSRRHRHRHHRERGERGPGDDKREKKTPKTKKTAKSTSAPSAPPPKPPSSSDDDDDSDSDDDEEEVPEESTALVVKGAATSDNPAAAVPKWLQSRVDNLTSKAVSFSRALVRAQQALKTSSRIAREAAQSFESELENFTIAQREIDREFQTGNNN